jgi:hypothetical protein
VRDFYNIVLRVESLSEVKHIITNIVNATFIDVDGIAHAYHPLEHFLLVLCQELASPQHTFLGMILVPTNSSIGSGSNLSLPVR